MMCSGSLSAELASTRPPYPAPCSSVPAVKSGGGEVASSADAPLQRVSRATAVEVAAAAAAAANTLPPRLENRRNMAKNERRSFFFLDGTVEFRKKKVSNVQIPELGIWRETLPRGDDATLPRRDDSAAHSGLTRDQLEVESNGDE